MVEAQVAPLAVAAAVRRAASGAAWPADSPALTALRDALGAVPLSAAAVAPGVVVTEAAVVHAPWHPVIPSPVHVAWPPALVAWVSSQGQSQSQAQAHVASRLRVSLPRLATDDAAAALLPGIGVSTPHSGAPSESPWPEE
jgi:hypothetical protein